MSNLMEEVMQTIFKYNMIKIGDAIIIGVSGGADSLCLLHVLKTIRESHKLKLFAVHLNHQFRGADADADAQYVEQICKAWDIPAFIETFDVPAYAKESGLSPEEAGREIRYRLFHEAKEKVGAQKIAVAQNRNDQVETILMRFLRGSGLDGLKGIDAVRDDIIRPLIETDRKTIEAYCRENGLEPRVDKTNLETIYLRNKIRLELLPYLQEKFNPNLSDALVRFAHIIKDENDYLDEETDKAFNKLAIVEETRIRLKIAELVNLHPAIVRRILRQGIEKLVGTLNGYEFKNIEGIAALLNQPTGAAIMLPKGIKAYISYDWLVMIKNIEKRNKKCYYKLNYDSDNEIEENSIIISVKALNMIELDRIERNKDIIYIDKEKIKESLAFRTRQEGDVFSPIGMKGSKKLKDYFIDEKIPREERDNISLLADGKEIVWVIGRRLSEKYKLTKDTKDVLVIKYLGGTYNE